MARSTFWTVEGGWGWGPGVMRAGRTGGGLCADQSPVVPGYPAPRLYWFKDGQPLTASAHIRMADRKTLHTLEVVSVTKEDAGQYSAYISNAVGATYSSARLLVRGGCGGLGVPTWAVQVAWVGAGRQ